jgi:hypothetical protein
MAAGHCGSCDENAGSPSEGVKIARPFDSVGVVTRNGAGRSLELSAGRLRHSHLTERFPIVIDAQRARRQVATPG